MITLNKAKHRALRNMTRAIARGDFDAALRWSLIFDGQLMIARRFSDLRQRRPRRRPRPPLPKPAPPQEERPAGNAKAPEAEEEYVMPLEFYYPEYWPNGIPPGPVPKSFVFDERYPLSRRWNKDCQKHKAKARS
jgi:hypothetical protein